ncbi:flagellar hook-length control protein FliK [Campylobacter sp. CX2-8023-23]|nr:flagellar hook-length control protein FliK [Campylobacter sp. CX2-8023-23]MEE3776337.1 flagellar hook-length control protein FliK [Campylobacter sp. CX2-4080-23]
MQGLNEALASLNTTTQVPSKSENSSTNNQDDSFYKMIENSVKEYETSQNTQDDKIKQNQIEQNSTKSNQKISSDDTENSKVSNLQNIQNSDEIMLENADFITLLGLLDSQDGAMKTGISNLVSANLNKFLATEKNIKELKGAKNLEDLLNLSEKFNLGLSKIKITKDGIEALKSEFKNLNSKGFFNQIPMINQKIDINVIKDIEKSIQKAENSDKNVLSKLMLGQSVEIKTDGKFISDDEPKPQGKSDIKSEQKVDLKELLKENFQKSEPKNTLLDEPKMEKMQTKSSLKLESSNTAGNSHNSQNSIDDYLANIMQKAMKETKESSPTQSHILESSSQTNGEQNSNNFDNQNGSNQATKDIINMAKLDAKELKPHLRQVFDNFATQLQEKISEYKPPITRFHLTLNPGNLGEVEVTLINRGSNLHINFNSNTQTMQLFIQHQAEFKASLVNMGFSELSMNFSDNANKEQSQSDNKRQKFNSNGDELSEVAQDEETILEVVLPKYF